MLITKNPWSSKNGIDAQRADLWVLDLDPVYDLVSNPSGVSVTPEYQRLLDNVDNSSLDLTSSAVKIVLPETNLASFSVISGSQYRNMPGYDEPLTVTRIEFWHDVPAQATSTVGQIGSAVYSLLACWQQLSMAGQQRFLNTVLPLIDSTSVPKYSCNLNLTLLNGGNSADDLSTSCRYLLSNCWISDLQLGDLDHTVGNSVLLAFANLFISSIQLTS